LHSAEKSKGNLGDVKNVEKATHPQGIDADNGGLFRGHFLLSKERGAIRVKHIANHGRD